MTTKHSVGLSVVLACMVASAEAGVVTQALKAAGKQLLGESAQVVVKKAAKEAAKRATLNVAQEAGEVAAKRTAAAAAKRFGTAAVSPQFVDDLAKGAASLTARNERRLMMIAPQLAQSGQAAAVVARLNQTGGDEVIELLWKHRGKIASGVAVTALLVHGDDIAKAGGEFVVKPVIDGAVNHVVAPVIWLAYWIAVLLSAVVVGVVAVFIHGGPAAERIKLLSAGATRLVLAYLGYRR